MTIKGDILLMNNKITVATILSASLFLSACTINIGTDSEKDNDKDNNKTQSQKNNESSNNDQDSTNDDSNQANNQNENTQSKEHYAKVWITGIEKNGGSTNDVSDTELEHVDVSGQPINPYNTSASKTLPEGTQLIAASPTAAGSVYYKDNDDGTITIYDVPSHFQDSSWDEDDFTVKETSKILNNAHTVSLKNPSQSKIDKVKYIISEGNPEDYQFDASDNTADDEVTRDNVIDKVEEYEGETLDTDTYTFKEPEKMEDGRWGFSFEDKDGNLAGSYIIDSDGTVTEYDEDGEEL